MEQSEAVRNRDIPLLRDVLYIMQEISAIEQRRDWQRQRMFRITQRYGASTGGGNTPRGIDAALAAIEEIDEEYARKLAEYAAILKKAEAVLNGISSHGMRAFVVMVYVWHRPKSEVILQLGMSKYAFKQARRAVERAENMGKVAWNERLIEGKQEEIPKKA